jgi:hypothetical protein
MVRPNTLQNASVPPPQILLSSTLRDFLSNRGSSDPCRDCARWTRGSAPHNLLYRHARFWNKQINRYIRLVRPAMCGSVRRGHRHRQGNHAEGEGILNSLQIFMICRRLVIALVRSWGASRHYRENLTVPPKPDHRTCPSMNSLQSLGLSLAGLS